MHPTIKNVLITGGAGFIGSYVADELINTGYRVRVLDGLLEQVHGPQASRPAYLHSDAELVHGDVRDAEDIRQALEGIDAVYHFAAAVGVGQSMYDVAHYTSVNNLGTAVLLETLIQQPVQRLIVASSMSIYGEGYYRAPDGSLHTGQQRSVEQYEQGQWELVLADGTPLTPVPTPEHKAPVPSSVYALSKYDQEVMCLVVGQAYNIPAVALRFFNVYGPRQSLSNPYTGVMAIFASRYLNRKPPLVFEDGQQQRDFVSAYDVAQACRLALEKPQAAGEVFNVGSGQQSTVLELAEKMADVLGLQRICPEVLGKYRAGDVRHCFADISKARRILGYAPRVSLEEGFKELCQWLEGQVAVDRVDQASQKLARHGLTVGQPKAPRRKAA
jgi:dTDP-L-rhamnose 4-epimerase